MSDWVDINVYLSTPGIEDTREAVRARIRAGHWLQGVHAGRRPGAKRLWINMAAVRDWQAGKPHPHLHGKGPSQQASKPSRGRAESRYTA